MRVAKDKPMRAPRFLAGELATDRIRHESVEGEDFTVVPIVALAEGVLHAANAPNPEFVPEEEIARSLKGWNGRPVVLGHPKREGRFVSANSPEVIAHEQVGTFYGAQVKNGKLRGELWISDRRVAEIGERAQAMLARLTGGEEIVEVSVGVFNQIEAAEGSHDGRDYQGVWRNLMPDHIALLGEGEKGACSAADGCGAPRWSKRAELAAFDVPCCVCSLPMTIAEAALQSIQPGALGAGPAHEACITEANRIVPANRSIRARQRREQRRLAAEDFDPVADFYESVDFRDAEMSDVDRRNAIEAALNDVESAHDSFAWVVAVFSDRVVYSLMGEHFQRTYSMSEDGKVTLGDDKAEVRPVTEFVPVSDPSIAQGGTGMDKTARIAALVADEHTPYTEDDRQWLTALEDAQVERLASASQCAACAEEAEGDEGEGEGDEKPTPKPRAAASGEPEGEEPTEPRNAEEWLQSQSAPADVREAVSEALSVATEEKENRIRALRATGRCDYSDDELRAMTLRELRRLSKMAQVPTFAGRAIRDEDQQSRAAAFYAEQPEDLFAAQS